MKWNAIMRTRIVTLILTYLLGGIALAGQPPKTGRELLAKMNSKSTSDQEYALAFVSGVYAAHTGNLLSPTGEELKKIVKSAKEYLEANPKRLDQSSVKLLKESFDKAVSPEPTQKKSFGPPRLNSRVAGCQ
jgi:hypothetical protein